jgi:hypothetical protein
MSASQSIKNRIREGEGTFFANDNISEFLIEGDIERLQDEVQEKVQEVWKGWTCGSASASLRGCRGGG